MDKVRAHFSVEEKTKIIQQDYTTRNIMVLSKQAEQVAQAIDSFVFSDLEKLVEALQVIAKGKTQVS